MEQWKKESPDGLKRPHHQRRAAQNVAGYPGSGDPTGVLQVLITAYSDAIEKYCRRRFVSTSYDELYNGTGDRRLLLRPTRFRACRASAIGR